MKIKEGFTLRTLCGEHIVVGEGLDQVNYNKIISLNNSAAYLWEQVQGKEFTLEDLATLLTDQYEVSADKALQDVKRMISSWQELGLIE
ncbi:MAG: PqqD family protein [Bacteroidaceae bacterium]|nr:PqqD family protein [Bacteroidaceae bacterium]